MIVIANVQDAVTVANQVATLVVLVAQVVARTLAAQTAIQLVMRRAAVGVLEVVHPKQ